MNHLENDRLSKQNAALLERIEALETSIDSQKRRVTNLETFKPGVSRRLFSEQDKGT